jgi:hypothetical protein
VCPIDPQHGQDPRCGGETFYTSNECSSEVEQSGTPPAAGVSWWIHGMSGDPMRLLRKRAALSPSRGADSAGWVEVRAQHGAAGGVSGVCDVWDVRTPLPASLERSPALEIPPKPQRRCLSSTAREKSVVASFLGPPRVEQCWRGRCRPATRRALHCILDAYLARDAADPSLVHRLPRDATSLPRASIRAGVRHQAGCGARAMCLCVSC